MHHTHSLLCAVLFVPAACSVAPPSAVPTGARPSSLFDSDLPGTAAPGLAAGTKPAATAPAVPPLRGDAADWLAAPASPLQPQWRRGAALMQGYFGATVYETIERTGGSGVTVDGSDDDLSQLPAIGGGAQWKLGGDAVQFGFEGMLGFSWRSGATAIAVGGGGAAVAVDVDLFLFDLYGGPFASMFLGDSVRIYASAGPMMQWGVYEESSLFDDGSSNGFGLGYYARTGLEFVLGAGSMIGLGVRWSDSQLDLGDEGDLDLQGFQLALTFSQLY